MSLGIGQDGVWHMPQPRSYSQPEVLGGSFGPRAHGPAAGFASLPQAAPVVEATTQHCRCGDLTLARPGVPCGRCGELP